MWGLDFALMQGLTTFADTSSAITSMRDYVMPLVQILSGLGGLASVFFIIPFFEIISVRDPSQNIIEGYPLVFFPNSLNRLTSTSI